MGLSSLVPHPMIHLHVEQRDGIDSSRIARADIVVSVSRSDAQASDGAITDLALVVHISASAG